MGQRGKDSACSHRSSLRGQFPQVVLEKESHEGWPLGKWSLSIGPKGPWEESGQSGSLKGRGPEQDSTG